jgi:hypothetical protein
VECAEEPWIGPPAPGGIEIRFRKRSPLDVCELSIVFEGTKLSPRRIADKQQRADLWRDRLSALNLGEFGAWLILADGRWSQS